LYPIAMSFTCFSSVQLAGKVFIHLKTNTHWILLSINSVVAPLNLSWISDIFPLDAQ
jgi:hypothetical protein